MTVFRGGSTINAIAGEIGATAQDLLDLILTVDGAGSTLDADTVDGEQAETFAYRANNLSDLDSASTAFSNIKQDASETATGVVEKATTSESQAGTAADKFPDVVGVKAHWDNRASSSETISGAWDFTGGLSASGSPVLADSDLAASSASVDTSKIPELGAFGITVGDLSGTGIPGAVGRGAIVESGTNSNGNYVRWENGVQVCWARLDVSFLGSNFSETDVSNLWRVIDTWTYPTAFDSIPSVQFCGAESADYFNVIAIGDSTGASASDFGYRLGVISSTAPGDGDAHIHFFAWGFWK